MSGEARKQVLIALTLVLVVAVAADRFGLIDRMGLDLHRRQFGTFGIAEQRADEGGSGNGDRKSKTDTGGPPCEAAFGYQSEEHAGDGNGYGGDGGHHRTGERLLDLIQRRLPRHACGGCESNGRKDCDCENGGRQGCLHEAVGHGW